jgi:hypothetical protein
MTTAWLELATLILRARASTNVLFLTYYHVRIFFKNLTIFKSKTCDACFPVAVFFGSRRARNPNLLPFRRKLKYTHPPTQVSHPLSDSVSIFWGHFVLLDQDPDPAEQNQWGSMRIRILNYTFQLGRANENRMQAVLRIRIHMFLGLPDPDPLIRGMDPDLSTTTQK